MSNPKFTPAKLAFAGTVFSATVAEVFTPVASGFAMAWVNDPLKSPKTGNWFSSVIGSSTRSGRGVHVSSQSKASSPHLSSHSIRYSTPAVTATSETTEPKVFGASQPSSSFAIGVSVSQVTQVSPVYAKSCVHK